MGKNEYVIVVNLVRFFTSLQWLIMLLKFNCFQINFTPCYRN